MIFLLHIALSVSWPALSPVLFKYRGQHNIYKKCISKMVSTITNSDSSMMESVGAKSDTTCTFNVHSILYYVIAIAVVCALGPCARVPGDPTDESCTRFRFAGSITRIGNVIIINYDALNKTDRKTYHWKWQIISFATRYPLN